MKGKPVQRKSQYHQRKKQASCLPRRYTAQPWHKAIYRHMATGSGFFTEGQQ